MCYSSTICIHGTSSPGIYIFSDGVDYLWFTLISGIGIEFSTRRRNKFTGNNKHYAVQEERECYEHRAGTKQGFKVRH